MHKRRFRTARALAEEAVHEAEGFGTEDFRLGVSLCAFGDALKADKSYQASEAAYKRAVTILRSAADRSAAAEAAGAKTGKKIEAERTQVFSRLVREDLANTLSHLAELYAIQEKHQLGADCYEKAAEIYQSVLKVQTPVSSDLKAVDDCPLGQELVMCLIGLARSSIEEKRYEAADEAYRRALYIAIASNSPEFLLADIRDSYIHLARQLGRTAEVAQLAADETFSKCTAAGIKSMFRKDYSEAEALFSKAYSAAQLSIFSKRRLMRSLFNLQCIFAREQRYGEAEQAFQTACKLMQTQGPHFDRDYDQMLSLEAKYLLQTGRAPQAAAVLAQQLPYRVAYFGPESIEVCETNALKGQAEFRSHNISEAEKDARQSSKTLLRRHMRNRRAGNAIMDTAQLMTDLNHFDEAEMLSKELLEARIKFMDPSDPRIVGYEANMFVLCFRFKRHDKAQKVVNDIVAVLDRENSTQRAQSMPYLVLIQSYALALNWYDIADTITTTGQSILHKDHAGATMDPMNQKNWTNGLARLKQHFGHKY